MRRYSCFSDPKPCPLCLHPPSDTPAQQPVESVEVGATEGPGEGEEKPSSPQVQSPQTGEAAELSGPITNRGVKSR